MKFYITAYKHRIGEGPNSYLDICAPGQIEVKRHRVGSKIQDLVDELISGACRMHEDVQGDCKINIQFVITPEELDDFINGK
jgi:hypothetical protein